MISSDYSSNLLNSILVRTHPVDLCAISSCRLCIYIEFEVSHRPGFIVLGSSSWHKCACNYLTIIA